MNVINSYKRKEMEPEDHAYLADLQRELADAETREDDPAVCGGMGSRSSYNDRVNQLVDQNRIMGHSAKAMAKKRYEPFRPPPPPPPPPPRVDHTWPHGSPATEGIRLEMGSSAIGVAPTPPPAPGPASSPAPVKKKSKKKK